MVKETIGSKVYTGVSTFGTVMADFKAIIGTIIGIILISVGIYLIRKQGVYTKQGTGIVKNNTCDYNYIPTPVTDDKGVIITPIQYKWSCNLTVVNSEDKDSPQTEKTEQIDFINNNPRSVPYSTNSQVQPKITIWVNPSNIKDFDLISDDTHILGWILVATGIVIMVGSIVWAYFANKYKIIGAYEGVRTGIDIFKNN